MCIRDSSPHEVFYELPLERSRHSPALRTGNLPAPTRADSPGDPRICWIQQHGIPETEEAILLLHRNTVSVPHAVDSSNGHDHSQQGAPWQVEVGDHGVHDTELVPGRDEQF